MGTELHNKNWFNEIRNAKTERNWMEVWWTLAKSYKEKAEKYLDSNKTLPPEQFNILVQKIIYFLSNIDISLEKIDEKFESLKQITIEEAKKDTTILKREVQNNWNEWVRYLVRSIEAVRDEIRDSSKWSSIKWYNKESKKLAIIELDICINKLKNKNISWPEAWNILKNNISDKDILSKFYSFFNKNASWSNNIKAAWLKVIKENVWEVQITDTFIEEMADTFLAWKNKLSDTHVQEINKNIEKQMQKTAWEIRKMAINEWNKNKDKIIKTNPNITSEEQLVTLYNELHKKFIKDQLTIKYVGKYVIWENGWISVPDSQKEIWETFKNSTDIKDEWTTLSLKWQQQAIWFMVYDVPAMLISWWIAWWVARLWGGLLLRWFAASSKLQRIAWITIKTEEITRKSIRGKQIIDTVRTIESTTRRWKLIQAGRFVVKAWTEWLTFTAVHKWIRNQEWFMNSPDWWKEVITNSIMFGSFWAAEKLVNRVYKIFPETWEKLIQRKAVDWLIKQWLTWPALYTGINFMLPWDLNAFNEKEITEIWQELALMAIMWWWLHFASPALEKFAGWFSILKSGDLKVEVNENAWIWEVTTRTDSKFKFQITDKIKNWLGKLKDKSQSVLETRRQKKVEKQVEKIWKEQLKLQKIQYDLNVQKAYKRSGIKPAEVEKNARLTDESRLSKAEELLWKTLSEEQKQAILEAHKIWEGKWVYNYNQKEITKKVSILRKKFDYKEMRILMENWIVWESRWTKISEKINLEGTQNIEAALTEINLKLNNLMEGETALLGTKTVGWNYLLITKESGKFKVEEFQNNKNTDTVFYNQILEIKKPNSSEIIEPEIYIGTKHYGNVKEVIFDRSIYYPVEKQGFINSVRWKDGKILTQDIKTVFNEIPEDVVIKYTPDWQTHYDIMKSDVSWRIYIQKVDANWRPLEKSKLINEQDFINNKNPDTIQNISEWRDLVYERRADDIVDWIRDLQATQKIQKEIEALERIWEKQRNRRAQNEKINNRVVRNSESTPNPETYLITDQKWRDQNPTPSPEPIPSLRRWRSILPYIAYWVGWAWVLLARDTLDNTFPVDSTRLRNGIVQETPQVPPVIPKPEPGTDKKKRSITGKEKPSNKEHDFSKVELKEDWPKGEAEVLVNNLNVRNAKWEIVWPQLNKGEKVNLTWKYKVVNNVKFAEIEGWNFVAMAAKIDTNAKKYLGITEKKPEEPPVKKPEVPVAEEPKGPTPAEKEAAEFKTKLEKSLENWKKVEVAKWSLNYSSPDWQGGVKNNTYNSGIELYKKDGKYVLEFNWTWVFSDEKYTFNDIPKKEEIIQKINDFQKAQLDYHKSPKKFNAPDAKVDIDYKSDFK